METDQANVAAVVDELLSSLTDVLPATDRPELELRAELIRLLLVPEPEFSVEGFVSSEVARALEH